jgi:hypothetical protein
MSVLACWWLWAVGSGVWGGGRVGTRDNLSANGSDHLNNSRGVSGWWFLNSKKKKWSINV